MATLREIDVPLRLYRYCRLDRPNDLEQEMDAAVQRYIFCSMYKRLNDPMEGYYQPSARLKKEETWQVRYRELLEAKQATGIACFSETFDNEIMWAHYAGNSTGMCVGYSTAKLQQKAVLDSAKLTKMSYVNAPLRLSKHDCLGDHYLAAHKILSHKKYSWAYEREWRLLTDHIGQQPYQGDIIAEIYFGSRTRQGTMQSIRSALAGRSVVFYHMRVTGYSHRWIKM